MFKPFVYCTSEANKTTNPTKSDFLLYFHTFWHLNLFSRSH